MDQRARRNARRASESTTSGCSGEYANPLAFPDSNLFADALAIRNETINFTYAQSLRLPLESSPALLRHQSFLTFTTRRFRLFTTNRD